MQRCMYFFILTNKLGFSLNLRYLFNNNVTEDRLRLGKPRINLRLLSACTIFVL